MKEIFKNKLEKGIIINIKLFKLKKQLQRIEKRLENTSTPLAIFIKHKVQDLERKL